MVDSALNPFGDQPLGEGPFGPGAPSSSQYDGYSITTLAVSVSTSTTFTAVRSSVTVVD